MLFQQTSLRGVFGSQRIILGLEYMVVVFHDVPPWRMCGRRQSYRGGLAIISDNVWAALDHQRFENSARVPTGFPYVARRGARS
jgi:hypothetical protein